MRTVWMSCLAAILCLASAAAADGDRPTLYVYSWMDYFDTGVISAFQEKYDCQVAITYFVSNEDLHETLQTSHGDFDLITPSSYMSQRLWDEGRLMSLSHDAIPNLRHLDRSATTLTGDGDMVYSIPFTRTICGIGYHTERVDRAGLGDWSVLGDARYRGRITLIADVRELIGAALKSLGYSLNSTDDRELAEAEAVIYRWLENRPALIDDSDRDIVNETDRLVSLCYNGDVALMINETDDSIGFFIPRGGGSIVTDDFVIPTDSQHPDLAHAFINHLLDPEMARRNMESVYFYMYVPAAVRRLPAALRTNPAFDPPADLVAQCEPIRSLGAADAKYEAIWERVLAKAGLAE